MNKIISCGEVWFVDLDPVVGHEQAKRRPCLVVSEDLFNQGPGGLAVIVPLTSKYRRLRWLVEVDPSEGGLSNRSYIMCHQPRAVSHDRFAEKRLGIISSQTLEYVKQRLRYLLAL